LLSNRYDSAGLATVTGDKKLHVAKFASGVTTSDALEKLRVASEGFKQDLHVGK
jgi:hypothetical protein